VIKKFKVGSRWVQGEKIDLEPIQTLVNTWFFKGRFKVVKVESISLIKQYFLKTI